ncbi:MAG TPA: tetratricopeptide repeat protein [Verrucomicrobiae bacterium]|nr:tetratricopeptide repeat protein [Verrucomicrobiae bacterium]
METSKQITPWMRRGIFSVVCLVVLGLYACVARLGGTEWSKLDPLEAYYNLLVAGFQTGQLSLKKEVPPGFAHLANPYDPSANRMYRDLPYRLVDLSYYKGRLYMYFGVTPALLSYWPYAAVSGRYVFDRQVTPIFCGIGFLACVAILSSLWRWCFNNVNPAAVTVCALALGLATAAPASLPWSDIYEVAITCGYMLTMLSLAAIWGALRELDLRKRVGWLAAASMAYGLAVGARPTLLLGAVMLLVPVAQAWREQRPMRGPWMAAVGPIAVIGAGLMAYNFLRFSNPLEFGQHYQLNGNRLVVREAFRLRYLWFNMRMYLLEPVRWKTAFPFVHGIAAQTLPEGYVDAQQPFGVLTNVPLVWLALAAPLAWRSQPGPTRSVLRWFVVAVALQAGMCLLTLGLFCTSAGRYELDFLPALVLLAVIGILGLERALALRSESERADRRIRRRVVRGAWVLALAFSILFNLLLTADNWGYAGCGLGTLLGTAGRLPEGIRVLQRAVRMKPDYAEGWADLGHTLLLANRLDDAIQSLEQALHLDPEYAEAHDDLGCALLQTGQIAEAIRHHREAVRLKPDWALGQFDLGLALQETEQRSEAITRYKEALRLNPNLVEAHIDLAILLSQVGSNQEARLQLEEAAWLRPDSAEVHYNLGLVLLQDGKASEAAAQFGEALRLKTDYPEAHFNLGQALEKQGRTTEAVEQYKQALQIHPGFAEARDALTRLRAVP